MRDTYKSKTSGEASLCLASYRNHTVLVVPCDPSLDFFSNLHVYLPSFEILISRICSLRITVQKNTSGGNVSRFEVTIMVYSSPMIEWHNVL